MREKQDRFFVNSLIVKYFIQTWYKNHNLKNSWSKFKEKISESEKKNKYSTQNIGPDDYKACHNLGIEQGRKNDHDLAFESYDRALKINSEKFQIWMGRT